MNKDLLSKTTDAVPFHTKDGDPIKIEHLEVIGDKTYFSGSNVYGWFLENLPDEFEFTFPQKEIACKRKYTSLYHEETDQYDIDMQCYIHVRERNEIQEIIDRLGILS